MIVIEVLSTPRGDSERDWQKPISNDNINLNTGGGGRDHIVILTQKSIVGDVLKLSCNTK